MAINEFDYVLLKKDTNMKVVQVVTNKPVSMCKMKFVLDGVLGHSYGSSFKLQNGQLEKLDFKELLDEDSPTDKDEEAEVTEARDNRSLVDTRENQRLSKEEIHTLRQQGVTGEGIIEHLVENSSTFQQKTEFSQQKYIKKKKKKHIPVFSVLQPNTRTLIEMYYSHGPTKICNLRMDSLAQILTQANIRSSTKTMVIESCSGIVIGAILERIAGEGAVVHLYTGSAPTRPALTEGYHFSDQCLQSLYSFPLDQVSTLKRPTNSKVPPSDELNSNEADAPVVSMPTEQIEQLSADSVCVTARAEEQQPSDIPSVKKPIEYNVGCDMSQPISDEVENPVETGSFCAAEGQVMVKLQETNKGSQSKESGQAQKEAKGNWRKRKFHDVEDREKRKLERLTQLQNAKSLIEKADMDGLIVAAKLHPTPIVMSLIDFVRPSRPIVVFSPYKEPLIDCFTKLREKGSVLMIKLTETWYRDYQVLTDRTHPSINMSGSGGYLLTATTVAHD